MFVVSEGGTNSLALHNLKTGAVCDAPAFLICTLVPLQAGGFASFLLQGITLTRAVARKTSANFAAAPRERELVSLKLFKSSTSTISLVMIFADENWAEADRALS